MITLIISHYTRCCPLTHVLLNCLFLFFIQINYLITRASITNYLMDFSGILIVLKLVSNCIYINIYYRVRAAQGLIIVTFHVNLPIIYRVRAAQGLIIVTSHVNLPVIYRVRTAQGLITVKFHVNLPFIYRVRAAQELIIVTFHVNLPVVLYWQHSHQI